MRNRNKRDPIKELKFFGVFSVEDYYFVLVGEKGEMKKRKQMATGMFSNKMEEI